MKHLLRRALARLSVLALAGAAFSPALAQDVATGKTLYNKTFVAGVKSCQACHFAPRNAAVMIRGADAARIKGASSTQSDMLPLKGVITDAEYNHMAAYIASEYQVTPTYISASAAPAVTLSATSLTFASQRVGTTSAAQTVTVTNDASATATLALSAIGTGAGSDFTVTGGTCAVGMSIAIGSSCTVTVVFKPVATGARAGTLTLAHNGPSAKAEVALSGTAVDSAPVAVLSPTTLSFSSVVGADSTVMRTTLSNTGNAALVLSSLALTGTHASEFRLASSTTCATSASVAGGSSCVVDVVFKPAATGARSASLSIAHNAAGGSAAVTLGGTGTLTPEAGIALDATDIDLGAQPVAATSTARTVTLTNTGAAALVISDITVTGTDAGDFVRGGTCAKGSSVASRATCTLTFALKPETLGAKNATLTISSNAPGAATTATLRGTAVRSPAPSVSLSQAALGFGTVTFGTTSVARNVVLTNSGTAPLTVTSVASSSTEYLSTHDCPATLAIGASCLISVSYKPVAQVTAESIVVTTNALSSPNSIVVTGEGSTQALSVVVWQGNSTALNFAATIVGETSASQTLTLVNQGPSAVTLTTLGIAGASASSYAIAGTSTCKLGLVLAANGTCTTTVNFVPGQAGTHVASLQVAGTGTSPGDITLTGTASAKATPAGALSGSSGSLVFSGTVVAPGATSAAQVLTVRNAGTGPAAITGITASGPFTIRSGVSGACPTGASSLAAGASCTVSVVFAPTVAGTHTGTLTVGSATTPLQVGLKGLSLAASVGVIAANPARLDFTSPATAPGKESDAKTVSVTNGAIAPVSITKVEVNAPFRIASNDCPATLAVNSSCTVAVVYAPSAAGASSGTLAVTAGTGQVLEVNLAGTSSSGTSTPGTPPDGGSTVLVADMASQGYIGALGQASEAKTTVFRNAGTTPLVIRDVNTSGPFEVTTGAADACRSAQTLAAGASCSVAVLFRAQTSTGDSTGALTVTAAATGSSTVESRAVRLDGRAMATNAGGRNDESGGGASDLATLLLLGLGVALTAAARARRTSRFS
ncbi:MAG: choice-of-anchor D domain-containing protein [Rhizobacter sp.]